LIENANGTAAAHEPSLTVRERASPHLHKSVRLLENAKAAFDENIAFVLVSLPIAPIPLAPSPSYIYPGCFVFAMELEQVFYTVAALFTFAAIVYFAWEYVEVLPRITKSFLLGALAVGIFMCARMFRATDR
jgi:hypothetical protein